MKKYSFKLVSSLLIITFSIFFAFPALFDNKNKLPNWWGKNKLKLGLDLQGGSQLLLQVETEIAIEEKLATQTEDLRTELLNEDIQPKDLQLVDNTILVKVSDDEIKKLKNIIKKNNQLEAEFEKEITRCI